MAAEVAYDPNGVAKAGMGIDAADVNGDGRPDFVITAFNSEYHSLFMNPGSFPFDDWTIASNLGFLTMSYVGWGTHFLDYDNDSIMDLLIVSGHVNKIVELTTVGCHLQGAAAAVAQRWQREFPQHAGNRRPRIPHAV